LLRETSYGLNRREKGKEKKIKKFEQNIDKVHTVLENIPDSSSDSDIEKTSSNVKNSLKLICSNGNNISYNINNNEIEKSSNRKRTNEGKNLIIIIIITS
jgi:Skp family chaperone for outer membrane proteins